MSGNCAEFFLHGNRNLDATKVAVVPRTLCNNKNREQRTKRAAAWPSGEVPKRWFVKPDKAGEVQ